MSDRRVARLAKALVVLSLFAAAVIAAGADLVGSGDRLQMLQKIQGNWQRECRRIVVDGDVRHEQTRLVISFTHLKFKTTEYANPECTLKLRQYQTVYTYRLGEAFATGQHKNAYTLDLATEAAEPGVIHLSALNLVAFAEGNLFFGARVAGGDETQRPTRLDADEPFKRY